MRGFSSILVASLLLAAPAGALAAKKKPRHHSNAPARVTCRPPYVRTVVRDKHHKGRTKVVCLAPYPLPPGSF